MTQSTSDQEAHHWWGKYTQATYELERVRDVSFRRGALLDELRELVDPAIYRKAEDSVAMALATNKYRHVKTGRIYEIVGYGNAQTVAKIVDMEMIVVYRKVGETRLWVRPRLEFMDGRFVKMVDHQSGGASTEAVSEAVGPHA